ncbi:hypothetical protein DSO57_1035000 [Entomophthora muscae]|uniref:Uncharacterized protein n=1 Tax=Entomophthora muscae TaxID=34485 RepID=A0ACC2SCM0_9FUNG|nr:hypothetical protein DSO57_1035000 [Entomophthora muscae]
MKQLLIKEFGGNLILEIKKNYFMHIAFKHKETLDEFSDPPCIEGQQLITSCQLTPWEVYNECSNALKVNHLSCLHFKEIKASLTSMKSIKTLLQDMHLAHRGTVARKNKAKKMILLLVPPSVNSLPPLALDKTISPLPRQERPQNYSQAAKFLRGLVEHCR